MKLMIDQNDTNLVRKTLLLISMILPLAGVILSALLLIRFARTSPSVLLPGGLISLMVGFYHLLFAGISYGMLTAIDENRSYPSWLKMSLYALGGVSISLGVAGIWEALLKQQIPFPSLQSIIPFFSVNSVPIGLYGVGVGILCICISALNEMKYEFNGLNLINGLMLLLVAIFITGFYLENGFNLAAAFLAGFYNLLLVFLSLGISGALNPEKRELRWLMNSLLLFGYGSIVLGGVEIIAVFLRPPSFLEPLPYKVISAILLGFYNVTWSGLCLGLSGILRNQLQQAGKCAPYTERSVK